MFSLSLAPRIPLIETTSLGLLPSSTPEQSRIDQTTSLPRVLGPDDPGSVWDMSGMHSTTVDLTSKLYEDRKCFSFPGSRNPGCNLPPNFAIQTATRGGKLDGLPGGAV